MIALSRRTRRRVRVSGRPGFSLVEVITAMALLAIVMTLLSSLAMSIGRRGRLNELTTKRNLALSQQASRMQVMSYTDLGNLSNSTTQKLIGDFSFKLRQTVTSPVAGRYTIKLVVAPIIDEFKPDSVTIDRTRTAAGSPLCTNC